MSVSRTGGYRGVLLLVTAASGISGLVLSVVGINAIPRITAAKYDNLRIGVCGIAVYFILLLVTRYGFHRIVTTELVLITGWTVLELCVVNTLNAAGKMTDIRFHIMTAVIAAAFVVSIILYVLYYRMEEMKAFYAAMIPLLTEGISMGILLGLTIF